MAYGADIPVAPVSTLELMIATYVRQESAQAGEIIALLDARMSEFNLGRYQLDDNKQIVALEADQLMTAEQVIELLKANNPRLLLVMAVIYLNWYRSLLNALLRFIPMQLIYCL